MRKTGTYHGSAEDVEHMGEVLQLMSMLTDDVRFQETIYGVKEGDGPKNMCEVLDKIEKQGIEKGIKSCVDLLKSASLSDTEIKAAIIRKFSLDEYDADKYFT